MLSPKAIIWSSNGSRMFRNVRRNSLDGPQVEVDSNETTILKLDLTHYLPAGGTITALSITPVGVTASATIDTPDAQSATITIGSPKTNGRLGYQITLSTGEITADTITTQNRTEGFSAGGVPFDA